MHLTDRTAVVTGSALRVGRAICLELARRGANVVVNYRTSAVPAAQLARELVDLGVGALAVQADVARADDCQRLCAEAEARFGAVDILVNNASTYTRTPVATLTAEEWDRSIEVNLKGPFLTCLEFGRRMQRRGAGAIVNIADWAVARPYVDYLPYLTAKGALVTLTRAFAVEFAPQVRVNAVAPGPILPPAGFSAEEYEESRAGTLLGRWGDPDDIARAVAFLIEGDFITGTVLPVDGGRLIA